MSGRSCLATLRCAYIFAQLSHYDCSCHWCELFVRKAQCWCPLRPTRCCARGGLSRGPAQHDRWEHVLRLHKALIDDNNFYQDGVYALAAAGSRALHVAVHLHLRAGLSSLHSFVRRWYGGRAFSSMGQPGLGRQLLTVPVVSRNG